MLFMSEDDLQEVRRYLETTTALADGRALGYLKRLLADRRVFERHVEAVASATLEEAAKVCEEEFERNKVPEGHAITRKQSAMDCAARIRARRSITVYRGWTIEPSEGVWRRGPGLKSKKYKGYLLTHTEDGRTKIVDTLKEATAYIDDYMGPSAPAVRPLRELRDVQAPHAADSTLLAEAERADELLVRRARIAAGTAWGPDEHQGVTPETAAANEREIRRILRECANRIESPEAAAQRLAERDSAR